MTLCAVIRGWDPPFPYRTGYTPLRDIVAAVAFTKADPVATQAAQQRARDQARHVYVQDAKPLVQLRAKLRNTLVELTTAPTLDKLDPKIWKDFQVLPADGVTPPTPSNSPPSSRRSSSASSARRLRRKTAWIAWRRPWPRFLPPSSSAACWISSIPSWARETRKRSSPTRSATPRPHQILRVSDVLIGDGTAIRDSLRRHPELSGVADRLFAWLLPRLKPTLSLDDQLTKESMDKAGRAVNEVVANYSPGQMLAKAGQLLGPEQIDLLRLEYAAAMDQRPTAQAGRPRRGDYGLDLRGLSAVRRPHAISPARTVGQPDAVDRVVAAGDCHGGAGPLGRQRRLVRRAGPRAAVRHDHGHRLSAGARPAAGRRGGHDRGHGDRAWAARVSAAVGRDHGRRAQPGTHPQPQQAHPRRTVRRRRGRVALRGHGHDRRPAARPARSGKTPCATACGRWRPASS